ncbi:hypothetical protein NQ317_007841 [Molorchus minor]|uniref:Barrier-to-autointegration factor n=1 Tax=Molorchus minor TaxID=1323400 RepID=A0ABQ9K4I7_9CUCU|nr:hypothetical protein NQ317_007841 [Molorchus minor]
MSSTSQKHRNFVAEPMGDKPVTDLAGVGGVLGERLVSAGFDKAYVVLGQFLVLKKESRNIQGVDEGHLFCKFKTIIGLLAMLE